MRYLKVILCCVTILPALTGEGPNASEVINESRGEHLTLEKALSMVLDNNPTLKALTYEVSARQSEVIQSGLLPNPDLEFELSEFAGGGGRNELNGAESTFLISQEIQLAGKRKKKKRTASSKLAIAQRERESGKLNLVSEVTKAFYTVLVAQERVELHKQLADLSRKTHQTVSARVKAGKVSPLEEVKTRVALSLAQVSFEQSKRERAAARVHLCSYWGDEIPGFSAAEGQLNVLFELPSLDAFLDTVGANPDIGQSISMVELEKSVLDLEKARKVPDISLTAGIQRFNEDDNNAFVLGVSVPFKVFDRNQGNIRAAGYRVDVAEQKKVATRLQITSEIRRTHELFTAIHLSASALISEIIPSAELAFEASSKGYQEGKFGLLDVLDAQRTLFETRAKYLDVLLAYHLSLVDLERISGSRMAPR